MPPPAISIAIPTLRGGPLLVACLASLERQRRREFEVVVIDNSGVELPIPRLAMETRVIRPGRNVGFAKAVNLAWASTDCTYLAALNDDTQADPGWLDGLVRAMEIAPDVGICASRVVLRGTERLDSAGMLLFGDGSSKQRAHGRPAADFCREEDVLFASASAALYRRSMIQEIGMFDEDFFLYCEDTDLGLRARRSGWRCRYVPDAIVRHHYSQSSSAASGLKAWYIERNRLWVAAKNFPPEMLAVAPFWTAIRYFWHAYFLLRGHGMAAEFRAEGHGALGLFAIVIRAHASLLVNAPRLLRKRRAIRREARLTDSQFTRVLKAHTIPAREIASL